MGNNNDKLIHHKVQFSDLYTTLHALMYCTTFIDMRQALQTMYLYELLHRNFIKHCIFPSTSENNGVHCMLLQCNRVAIDTKTIKELATTKP